MDNVGIDTIWVLIATALVMLMQAGFALVEIGLTRAKNSINILMKNFVDFSTGSLIFWAFGFALMFGEDVFRSLEGLYYKLSGKNTSYILPSRRKFISQVALGLAAIPFASMLYGVIKGRYNFKVLKYTLHFEDLPAAFDGYP